MQDFTRWRLKFLIAQSPYTQARLARAIGRDPSWLSKVVNGVIDPEPDAQARLASALDTTVSRLFSETPIAL